jgi:hypothetical protein
MSVREAKDFLVDQAAQQAAIDGVPLSDLEERTMYFTEWDDSGTRLPSIKSLRRRTTPKNTSQKSQSLCDTLTLV